MNQAQAHTIMNELRSSLKTLFGVDIPLDAITDITTCEHSMMLALQQDPEEIAKEAAKINQLISGKKIADGLWIILAALIEALDQCDKHCADKSMKITQRLVLFRIMMRHMDLPALD